MKENEKKVATLKGEEEVLEQVRASAKKVALEEKDLTEEEKKLWEKAMAEMNAPIEFKDSDFKLGEHELDIRGLSKKNKEQLQFRMECAKLAHLRQIAQSQIDIMRLIMVGLKKMGVDDIEQATDDLMTELNKKVRENGKNNA